MKLPFILILFSFFASAFTALSGFGTEFARGLKRALMPYIIIWLLWYVVEDKEDFKFLFKWITVVMFVACILGLYEYTVNDNFLLNYKLYLSGGNLDTYSSLGIRGYRLTSVFEHPIGCGMVMGLYFSLVSYLIFVKNAIISYRKLAVITAILCIPCILLTKMRSAILFTIICCLSFISLKSLRKKTVAILIGSVPILFIFFAVFMKDQIFLITSLFSTNTDARAGGSSLAMRLNQFNAIKQIFFQSPFSGLGETFRLYIERSQDIDAALGFESVWFEQMAMHGSIGIISQALLLYYTVFKIPRLINSRPAAVFAIAYWITYSITSIPSFRLVLLFLIEFYFIKQSEYYKSYSKRQNEQVQYKYTKMG